MPIKWYRTGCAKFAQVSQQVSTRPVASSYIWGGQRSPLAYATFHAFFLLRLLSPLQWLKYRVRRRGTPKPPTTNIRPDFPAAYTEWYFIFMLAATAFGYVLRYGLRLHPPAPLVVIFDAAGCFLLLECIAWVLYYMVIRAFVEHRYTIYHPAEYILMFPLIIAVQVLFVADMTGRSVPDLLQALIGNPQPGDWFGTILAVAGFVYLGVAITVVFSSHPGIATRHSQIVAIIGAGDATINRILPALKVLGYERGDIVISSVEDPEAPAIRAAIGMDARLRVVDPDKVLDEVLRERCPTIIASPTFAHFTQLVTLAGAEIPFAVEKPIAAARSERALLRAEADRLMARGFALSYYTLEKALPLTYFLEPLPAYARFLIASEPGLLGGEALQRLHDQLGMPLSTRIELLEGASRSPSGLSRLWTEVPETLRPLVETAIHPLLLFRHVTGSGRILWLQCALGRYAPRAEQVRAERGLEIAPTWLEATGAHGSIEVSMLVAKHVPDRMAKRTAVIEYSGGTLVCDFDQRRLDITVGGQHRGWIAIDSGGRYKQNYAVQMQLFMDFVINGWGPIRFDDFEKQLDALDAWDDLCDAVDRANTPVIDYTAASILQGSPSLQFLPDVSTH